jgi:hypothetical protein
MPPDESLKSNSFLIPVSQFKLNILLITIYNIWPANKSDSYLFNKTTPNGLSVPCKKNHFEQPILIFSSVSDHFCET